MNTPLISRRTFGLGLTVATTSALAACSAVGEFNSSTASVSAVHPLASPTVAYTPDFSAGPTIFPQPGAKTAHAQSQITFRGVTQAELEQSLSITGSESGEHADGAWIEHSDGFGVSFQPAEIFTEGETVTVAVDGITFQNADGDPTFTVGKQIDVPLFGVIEDLVETAETRITTFVSDPTLETMAMNLVDGESRLASNVSILPSAQGKRGIGIYSNTGELTYWHAADPDYWHAAHTEVVTIAGQPVLTWFEGKFNIDLHHSQGEEFFLDSSYEQVTTGFAPGNGYLPDLHEFFVTNHNSVFISIYNPVQLDLREVGGEAEGTLVDGVVQEIDLTTGAVLFEWHAIDNLALGESFANFADVWDWVHLNSIKENAAGEILISLRDTNSVMLLNHESGKRIWKLGGATAADVSTSDAALLEDVQTFTLGDGVRFSAQHDARFWADGRLSLYDNQDARALTTDNDYEYSRGLVFDLDYDNFTATLHQDFVHPENIWGLTQGSIVRLDDGGALVSWGNNMLLTEFDQNTDVVAHWELTGALATYRVELAEDWVGTPTTVPSVVCSDDNLYVSWNGATEVASWQVLSNDEVLTTADRGGFETVIDISGSAASSVQVAALDTDGNVLATSQVVSVS